MKGFFAKGKSKTGNEEQSQVYLMLGMGFCMGVFLSVYQVTADSLFLSRLGEYLDMAFLLAGILGILSTALFSTLQNKIKYSILVKVSLLLIFLFTTGIYVLLRLNIPAWQNVFLFAMYCMTGPIMAVLLLGYWGIFSRLFNFRQSKRMIGWIDTGQLLAAILASFSIPFSQVLMKNTTNYLLVCSVSIMAMFILMTVITYRYKMSKNDPDEFEEGVKKETTIKSLFSNSYIRLLSVFLLVSMLIFLFGQYAFQQLVREKYTSERELTNFNAFFSSAAFGLSLILQTFINHKVISNYGLKIALLVLPVVVIGTSAIALVFGGLLGFGVLEYSTGFLYFFLFVSLNRLFSWVLRDSLETPVFKLFFIPLKDNVRFAAQSKVEGIANESSRFLVGLLIFLFGLIPAFHLSYVLGLILLLAIAYFVTVKRMYNGYRMSIRMKLESADLKLEKLEKGFTKVTLQLEGMLHQPVQGKAVFSFKLLEKINASNLSIWINTLMKSEDDATRHYAQEKMNEMKGLSVSDKYVIRAENNHKEGKHILAPADLRMIFENGGEITKMRIQRLSRSLDAEDRHYAAELLMHTPGEDGASYLMELLGDNVFKVRDAAIKTSIRKYNHEIINALIENLGHPVYSNRAFNALIQIGEPALQSLDIAFFRSSQNTLIMQRTLQVMGRIGGNRAKEMLWNKMDYPNELLVSQVFLSLGECGFKAGPSQVARIKYAIEADIADIRWNSSAIQEMGEEGFAPQIKQALRWEVESDIEHIYMLLTMLYDTRSIQLIKENIESGTAEGTTFAIELLDVLLPEQLKQRVIPVLDDLSEYDRIGRLDQYFPRAKLDNKLALKFIINRDFTQSNRWTKACALFQIGLQKIHDFNMDLIAHLYNPDPIIREVSAWSLYQINQDDYLAHVLRLPNNARKQLNKIILESSIMMRFEKVMFFQRIVFFDGIPGLTLSYLADISEEIRLVPGDTIVLDERVNNFFYLILTGSVDLIKEGQVFRNYKEGQFIGEMLALPHFLNTNILTAKSHVVALKINKDEFYELLSGNVELADKVLESV